MSKLLSYKTVMSLMPNIGYNAPITIYSVRNGVTEVDVGNS